MIYILLTLVNDILIESFPKFKNYIDSISYIRFCKVRHDLFYFPFIFYVNLTETDKQFVLFPDILQITH